MAKSSQLDLIQRELNSIHIFTIYPLTSAFGNSPHKPKIILKMEIEIYAETLESLHNSARRVPEGQNHTLNSGRGKVRTSIFLFKF
jgi:hypothetical protein